MFFYKNLVLVMTVVIAVLFEFSQERTCIDRIHASKRDSHYRDCVEYFKPAATSINKDGYKTKNWQNAIHSYKDIYDLQNQCKKTANKNLVSSKFYYCKSSQKVIKNSLRFWENQEPKLHCECETNECKFQHIVFAVFDNKYLRDLMEKWVNELTSNTESLRQPRLLANQTYDTLELFCRDYNILEELVLQFNITQLCLRKLGFNADDLHYAWKCETENGIVGDKISPSQFERLLKCMAVRRLPASPLCNFFLRRHAMLWLVLKLAYQYDYLTTYATWPRFENLILVLLDLEDIVGKMNRSTMWLGNGMVKPYRGPVRRCVEEKVEYEDYEDEEKSNKVK
jgi:hypothetical protein